MGEDSQTDGVLAFPADILLQAGDRLQVVVEDLGPTLEDDVDGVGIPLEVGDEHFDGRAGPGSDGRDAAAEVVRAAVGEVVAGHGGDDHMLQAEPRAGFGEAVGFVKRDGLGLASLHCAEAAGTGAGLAEDHECRRPPGPALRPVRALTALADCLEPRVRRRGPA